VVGCRVGGRSLVRVVMASGESDEYDHVIIATQANQALALIKQPSPTLTEVLPHALPHRPVCSSAASLTRAVQTLCKRCANAVQTLCKRCAMLWVVVWCVM
jgi:predicted NAD/FAD-binding protein